MSQDTAQGILPIDIDAALANPRAYFEQPQDVLAHPGMSKAFQMKLLRHWEHDARLLAEAETEGMGGGESSMLGRVREAIRMLEATMSAPSANSRRDDPGPQQRPETLAEIRKFICGRPIGSAVFMLLLGYWLGRPRAR